MSCMGFGFRTGMNQAETTYPQRADSVENYAFTPGKNGEHLLARADRGHYSHRIHRAIRDSALCMREPIFTEFQRARV